MSDRNLEGETPDPTGAGAEADTVIDVIPDVHGQAVKLEAALKELGYRERDGAWRHDDPGRTALFQGDLIDGKPGYAPEEARTLGVACAMVEAGSALCLMGNHELNAIHFHATGPDGAPLRPHCKKNRNQHAAFLTEHPLGSEAAREAIERMQTLPVAIEAHGLRAVHACWSESAIDVLRGAGKTRDVPGGTAIYLSTEALHAAAGTDAKLYDAVETVLKGPEENLPDGASFRDKNGDERHAVRLSWWRGGSLANRSKTIRRLEELRKGRRLPDLMAAFVPVLGVPATDIEDAIADTQRLIEKRTIDAMARIEARAEAHYRDTFRPHAVWTVENRIPRPIFVAVIIGPENLLCLDFPDDLPAPERVAYATEHCPKSVLAFDRTLGFAVNEALDHATIHTRDGTLLGALSKAVRIGQGTLGGLETLLREDA